MKRYRELPINKNGTQEISQNREIFKKFLESQKSQSMLSLLKTRKIEMKTGI